MRVVGGRHGHADQVSVRSEVQRDVEIHVFEAGAVWGVVEEPGAEDEVEGFIGVAGWGGAVGEDEVDGWWLGEVWDGGTLPTGFVDHDGGYVNSDDGARTPFEEVVGVEPGAAGEFEDTRVFDEGLDGRLDVFALDEGDGFGADVVVRGLDGVVLGWHGC